MTALVRCFGDMRGEALARHHGRENFASCDRAANLGRDQTDRPRHQPPVTHSAERRDAQTNTTTPASSIRDE